MEWTSVKNQFFTAILSADSPGKQLTILPEEVNVDAKLPNTAIQASVGYALGSIAPGGQVNLTAVTLWSKGSSGYKL